MRKENSDNMNAHLNWQADDVLEFELVLYNPLAVPLPLTSIELFEESGGKLIASMDSDLIGNLTPQDKTRLVLRFRASQRAELVVSHIEIVLFAQFKTRVNLDANGLNPINTEHRVSPALLYVNLRKPYFIDINRIKVDERAPSVFIKA